MTDQAPRTTARAVLAGRLGLGLVQGLALYALSRLLEGDAPHPWVTANPKGFGLLALLATLLPLPILLGLGHVRGRVLAAWAVGAAGLILLLGGHDLRQHGETTMTPASNGLLVCLGAILFIGQALVGAADGGRRWWWPRYPDCFEAAWRTGLQLALAGCFVLGFWLVYWIGSELFRAIGVEALYRIGGRAGFALPVTAVLGAAGIHLADAGWRLTLGLRNLLLGLKAWLTPILTGLAVAFILALPFTGLEILWSRDDAPGWLIATAAGLVVLVSAVHGDGRETPPAALSLSARLASFLLPVLVALAGWVLVRQAGDQGLTEGRVVGAAALAVLGVHAVAYPIAATRSGMRLLEPANIVAAMLAIPVLAALNLPLADPARLEVRDRTHRLLSGALTPDGFDFDRLRRSGRDGRRALADLTGHPDPEIARRARRAALPSDDDAQALSDAGATAPRLRAVPAGASLPPGLVGAMRKAMPECLVEECLARAFPQAGEGAWLVGPIYDGFWAMRPEGEGWKRTAVYEPPFQCQERVRTGSLAGPVQASPPRLPDLDLGGVLFRPTLQREECG